jgi:RNA polymerase sigma-70 factor (ECF subfamily)
MASRASNGAGRADAGTQSGPSPTAAPVVDLRDVIAQYYQDIYRYAYRLSGNRADAEDYTQQTFLVAQAKLSQLREPAKARNWLFAVLRSCFLKSIGRKRPILTETLDLVQDEEESARASGAIDQEDLRLALQDLPEDYRLVVLMFYFDELSYKEIAEQMGTPIGTVMSRLARAKARLRERLSLEPQERKLAGVAP